MVNAAVVLSGCGVFDGSEIHEAVVTLLALDRAGADVSCFAPDVDQADVIDHAEGSASADETRSVLAESARIARGEIAPLSELDMDAFECVLLPGGFGAAKNLCDFASAGAEAKAQDDIQRVIREAHSTGKVIGAMCIAPAAVASALKGVGVTPRITIGSDAATAEGLEAMGAEHVDCEVGAIVVDEENRIVTTPAYMLAGSIGEAANGIEQLVAETLRLATS